MSFLFFPFLTNDERFVACAKVLARSATIIQTRWSKRKLLGQQEKLQATNNSGCSFTSLCVEIDLGARARVSTYRWITPWPRHFHALNSLFLFYFFFFWSQLSLQSPAAGVASRFLLLRMLHSLLLPRPYLFIYTQWLAGGPSVTGKKLNTKRTQSIHTIGYNIS